MDTNELFEINDLNNISIEEFDGSKIYYMDNFYKNPDDVKSFINLYNADLWKKNEKPSLNGDAFIDRRHFIKDENFLKVTSQLSSLLNLDCNYPSYIMTNCTLFRDKDFNDYQNNYWFPHIDPCHVALIYFDENEGPGTNLYERIEKDINPHPEHFAPWRPKSKYNIIKTLYSKYNRLIIFDGQHFLHGMSIVDDTFFNIERMNQAIFFDN